MIERSHRGDVRGGEAAISAPAGCKTATETAAAFGSRVVALHRVCTSETEAVGAYSMRGLV